MRFQRIESVRQTEEELRVHQHLDIGQGEVPWDTFFGTLGDLGFDGRGRLSGSRSQIQPTTLSLSSTLPSQAH